MTLSSIHPKQLTETIPFAFASLALMIFLFFIDEGYYSFGWASDPMSVLGLVVVSAFLVAGQMFTYKVVLSRYSGSGKGILSFILGTVISFVSLFMLAFLVYVIESLVTGNWQ